MKSSSASRLLNHKLFRRFCLAACDLALCAGALLLALQLRFFPAAMPEKELAAFWEFLPLLLLVRFPVFAACDLYRLSWRYVGVTDLLKVLKATTLSAFAGALILNVTGSELSRGVLILDWLIITLFLGGLRLALRLGSNLRRRINGRPQREVRRVLIVGVNDLAESLARDFERRTDAKFRVVGFLDDQGFYQGQTIHGRPVLGGVDDVAGVVVTHAIQELVLAMPEATGPEIRRIIRLCERLPVRLRILQDPWNGHKQLALAQVRDISLEDLLRRPPVRVNLAEVAGYLEGEVVLVTGAGGSIGSELVRQIARLNPRKLLLLGRGEHSVFQIHMALQQELGLNAVPVIADIRDQRRLERLFAEHRPTVVFHAAAHKHVPLMEGNIAEAVKNNILGTRNLLRVSERFLVQTFVLISTDKAVRPSSVMGCSKRIAEMLVQSCGQRARGRYMIVRFGNVLGSRGSVVPIIQNQILQGLPVTLTHPEMERFFMTIPEAVSLVIQAGAMGCRGEVFVLDMGEPVRIVELARELVRLCGLVPDQDVRFRFTGIRPGEKLKEEILTAQEALEATLHDRIFHTPAAEINDHWLQRRVDALAEAAAEGDDVEILHLFRELVPTFRETPAPPPPSGAGDRVARADSRCAVLNEAA
jgi:FlaA1/EpsC-like NDP-sugar epimerase